MKKMEDIYQGSIAINGMYETNDMYRCLVIYKDMYIGFIINDW